MERSVKDTARAAIDLKDPQLLAAPAAGFDRLRRLDPVHWHEPAACWLISGYHDAANLLKDRERFGADLHQIRGYDRSRPFGAGSAVEAHMEGSYFFMDRPEHTRLRRVSAPRFTRGYVEREMAHTAEKIVDDLLDAIPTGNVVDLVPALAFALPQRILTMLIGLPIEDGEQLKRWTVAYHNAADPGPSPDQLAVAESATVALHDYLLDKVHARRNRPSGDLVDVVIAARRSGQLRSDEEIVNQLIALVVANETTSTLICGAFESLEQHPDQWERLRHQPELVPTAVEEFLRFTSPAAFAVRVALTDVKIGGRMIRKGDVVQVALMGANHDPSAFAEPGRLDLGRSPNPHLAFGGGEHTCLGAHLARLEARILFGKALRRWSDVHVELDGVRRLKTIGVRGYERFPVEIRAV